jgi:flagellar hook-basal body complex protein FliE
MNLLRPELTFPAQMPLATSDPLHYKSGASLNQAGQGANIANMAKTIGADVAVDGSGRGDANFADVMLRAIDQASAEQMSASALAEQALVDPDSVDIQDLTIAQAKATQSLDLAKTVLDRLLQSWEKLANMR